jgi:nickel superoxide dismutase
MLRSLLIPLLLFGLLVPAEPLLAHCQIPCGIYGDDLRFGMMSENLDTIEKAMKQIVELSAEPSKNLQQVVRWTGTKDEHADQLAHTLTQYFLQQRIPLPKEGEEAARKGYLEMLETVHAMLVHAMKAKQTTDAAHVQELRKLLESFKKAYGAKN